MTTKHIQLGKQGLTANFMETLKNYFKKNEGVRISVLKSARPEREKVKEYAEEILEKLGKHYTSRVIGFTIVLRKWRKR
jgi:RNA-binding protein YhbY